MGYTIGQAAKKVGLSVYTLRYYEKEGLLPFVDRTASGIRSYKDSDFDWLGMIGCLKNTGMNIHEIRDFVTWCMEGDATLPTRIRLFYSQKRAVKERIREFEGYLEKIDHKIAYYTQEMRRAGMEIPVDDDDDKPL